MKKILTRLFVTFRSNHSGQSLTEYALILAVIALVAVAAVRLLGTQISTVFTSVMNSLR